MWLDLAMGILEKVVIFSYTYRLDLITVFASLNTMSHFGRSLLAIGELVIMKGDLSIGNITIGHRFLLKIQQVGTAVILDFLSPWAIS